MGKLSGVGLGFRRVGLGCVGLGRVGLGCVGCFGWIFRKGGEGGSFFEIWVGMIFR